MKRYCKVQFSDEDFGTNKLTDIEFENRIEAEDIFAVIKLEEHKKPFDQEELMNWYIQTEPMLQIYNYSIKSEKEKREEIVSDFYQTLMNLFYAEIKLDITEELYLAIKSTMEHKEKLWLEFWKEDTKVAIGDDNQSLKKQLEYNIDNLLKSKIKYKKIFDTEEIKGKSKKLEVDSFGINVKRIWLLSKNFRNLFSTVYHDSYKYEFKKIYENLEKVFECFDKESSVHLSNESSKELKEYDIGIDDEIILQYLLKPDIWYSIIKELYSFFDFSDEIEDEICKLINILNEYPGYHLKCKIIKQIREQFSKFKYRVLNDKSKKEMLKIIVSVLEDAKEAFCQKYRIHLEYAKNKIKSYRIQKKDALEYVTRSRRWIIYTMGWQGSHELMYISEYVKTNRKIKIDEELMRVKVIYCPEEFMSKKNEKMEEFEEKMRRKIVLNKLKRCVVQEECFEHIPHKIVKELLK